MAFLRIFSQVRAPDNFLKQGVADPSLEAKGVILQNPEVFFTPKFLHKAFLEVANLVLGNRKNAAYNWSLNLPTLYQYTCYVVIIYLRDSDQFIKKKKKKDYQTDVEIKLDVAVNFPENVCLAQVVRANEKAGLITT